MNSRPPGFEMASSRRQKVMACGLDPDYWYAVEYDHRVRRGQVKEVRFWGRSIALYRTDTGQLRAMENRCAHRQVKLSHGRVDGCRLTCAYHGWSYGPDGRLEQIPHELFGRAFPSVGLRTYPVEARYGLIWIFMGDATLASERTIPPIPEPPDDEHAGVYHHYDFTWQAHHSLIAENNCDYAHAYLHGFYQPFRNPILTSTRAEEDRIVLRYQAKMVNGWLMRHFVHEGNVDTNGATLYYQYPYVKANIGGKILQWVLLLPMDERTTRVFYVYFFCADAFRIPFTPFATPPWLLAAMTRVAQPIVFRPIFSQDGWACAREQEGYESAFDTPCIELNPAMRMFQQLTIRKWEEHLARQNGG